MPPIARCNCDQFTCPKQPPGIRILEVLPVTRRVDGYVVARLGDIGVCHGNQPDMIVEGSAQTLVCGLPIARLGDAMKHGGVIYTGSPTEEDGGTTWRLPSNLKIEGDSTFQNKVIRDLFAVSQTPNGAAALNAIEASGKEVTIVKGFYNASRPTDEGAIRRGGQSGTEIDYDPDNLEVGTMCKEGCMAAPPQLSLGHELIHAARWGRGGATMSHAQEEEQVVGPPVGKKDKDPNWPTENGLRKDLNLCTRTTYKKCENPPPAQNRRPGTCP